MLLTLAKLSSLQWRSLKKKTFLYWPLDTEVQYTICLSLKLTYFPNWESFITRVRLRIFTSQCFITNVASRIIQLSAE